jgi:hypothetical protein
MQSLIVWILPLFLIISGLNLAGVTLPRWVNILGGVCGIIAGVLIGLGVI